MFECACVSVQNYLELFQKNSYISKDPSFHLLPPSDCSSFQWVLIFFHQTDIITPCTKSRSRVTYVSTFATFQIACYSRTSVLSFITAVLVFNFPSSAKSLSLYLGIEKEEWTRVVYWTKQSGTWAQSLSQKYMAMNQFTSLSLIGFFVR